VLHRRQCHDTELFRVTLIYGLDVHRVELPRSEALVPVYLIIVDQASAATQFYFPASLTEFRGLYMYIYIHRMAPQRSAIEKPNLR